MCLILLAYNIDPRYKLILLANRDEFIERPTARANWWDDNLNVLGGRDLQAGGTWMAVEKEGYWSAVTNYREGGVNVPYSRSRGDLVSNFVTQRPDPAHYLKEIQSRSMDYQGFNLLLGTPDDLYYITNRNDSIQKLEEGIYGLSNHLLDSAWPKVEKGKSKLRELIESGREFSDETAWKILNDSELAEESSLPHTGVPFDIEKNLSSMFISNFEIQGHAYGTRVSSILTIDSEYKVHFSEMDWTKGERVTFDFDAK